MNAAIDWSEPGESAAEAATPRKALVLMNEPPQALASTPPLTRPNPSFVAQLIATAEHAPQTCALRRASPAVAQAAYGTVTSQSRIKNPGHQLQQII